MTALQSGQNFSSIILSNVHGQAAGNAQVKPSGGVSYTRSDPASQGTQTSGASDRVVIDIDPHLWADLEFALKLVVRTYRKQGGRRFPGEQVTRSARAPGLALMSLPHAVTRGLADALPGRIGPAPASSQAWLLIQASDHGSEAGSLTSGRSGHTPGSGENERPPGFLLPPSNVLRGDGLGYMSILQVPDMWPFVHENVLPAVYREYPADHADAIAEVLANLSTLKGTESMMENLLGGLSFVIPIRDTYMTSTYTLQWLGYVNGKALNKQLLASSGL